MAAVTQGPLKDFLATRKSNTLLISRVDRYLQSRKPDTSRRSDVLHPSEIVGKDWCLRASYHLLRGADPNRVSHPLRLENIFHTGHDIHNKWQSWAADAGVLYGDYVCGVCGASLTRLGWPDEDCQVCDNDQWRYGEIRLEIPHLRIAGHTDGWLKFHDADDHLLEIKSVGTGTLRTYEPSLLSAGNLEESFKRISRPFSGHVRQVQVYLEALRLEHGGLAPDKALILYECKANQDVREFVVERNSALVEDVFDRAYEVVMMAEAGEEPPCSINPDSTCAKCKGYA